MAIQDCSENLWAIVLAAGEGTRLSTLTGLVVTDFVSSAL